jgi:hypothetical protein
LVSPWHCRQLVPPENRDALKSSCTASYLTDSAWHVSTQALGNGCAAGSPAKPHRLRWKLVPGNWVARRPNRVVPAYTPFPRKTSGRTTEISVPRKVGSRPAISRLASSLLKRLSVNGENYMPRTTVPPGRLRDRSPHPPPVRFGIWRCRNGSASGCSPPHQRGSKANAQPARAESAA